MPQPGIALDFAKGFPPVHARHVQVQQDQRRRRRGIAVTESFAMEQIIQQLFPIRDTPQVRRYSGFLQCLARQEVVVVIIFGNEDSGTWPSSRAHVLPSGCGRVGNLTMKVLPAPTVLRAVIVPP